MSAPETDPRVRYRASFERRIRAIKEAVPVERYASETTNLENFGGALRGPCPVHGGGNPTSFSVRPEAGRAHCFACGFDGDVLDLFMGVESYAEDEKAFAAQALADRYSVELPARPESWHRKEAGRVRVLDGIQNALAVSYRRRIFRVLRPLLNGAGESEAREVWRALWPVARECAGRRLAERGLL